MSRELVLAGEAFLSAGRALQHFLAEQHDDVNADWLTNRVGKVLADVEQSVAEWAEREGVTF